MNSQPYIWAIFAVAMISCTDGNKGATTFRGAAGKDSAPVKPDKNSDEDDSQTPEGQGNGTPTSVTFQFGGDAAKISRQLPADFLFVLDNSFSMNTVYDQVKAAILNIPKERYPQNAKIAVMTGMPAVFPNPSVPSASDYMVPHAAISRGPLTTPAGAPNPNYYFNIGLEPGFLNFINKTAILNFKSSFANAPTGNTLPDKYALSGCDNQWFSPDDKDANGVPCIAGALQNTFYRVDCEPNIIAFQQMLEKYKNRHLFRPGAFLHVIFVSDEAHPGCSAAGNNTIFTAACKTFDQLQDDVLANTKVAGLKFHGIVPSAAADANHGTCGYRRQLIDPSNGVAIDSQDETIIDYSPMIETVAASSFATNAMFQLPDSFKSLKRIEIDDVEFTGKYSVSDDKVLTIEGLDLKETKTFNIFYSK